MVIQEVKDGGAPFWYRKDGQPRRIAKQVWRHKSYGRKKGSKNKSRLMSKAKANAVLHAMATWVEEVKDPKNKKMKIGKWHPMSMMAACRELQIDRSTVMSAIKWDPSLKKMYENYRDNKQELMRYVAEDNITRWLNWELDLDDKEVTDLSIKVSEKTDKAYNPRAEVEQKVMALNFNVDISELEKQFNELKNM